MWKLTTTIEIDAAHFLPAHPGKCKNLHGHRWRITFIVSARALNDQGMVVDFGELAELPRKFDHTCLNDHPAFKVVPSTAENMAAYLAKETLARFEFLDRVSVIVEETPGSEVMYCEDRV